MAEFFPVTAFAVFLCIASSFLATVRPIRLVEDFVLAIVGNDQVARELAGDNQLEFLGPLFVMSSTSSSSSTATLYLMSSSDGSGNIDNVVERLKRSKHVLRIHVTRQHSRRVLRSIVSRYDVGMNFNDPLWDKMWHLNPKFQMGRDLNVFRAWQIGYTGRGVVVAVIDDGLEVSNKEIKLNYLAEASFDVTGNDGDPTPRYDGRNTNRHGTRCAGIIAARVNNNICGMGVAFNARIGGLRLLDGQITDPREAKALAYRTDIIDIYNVAWGPPDDGLSMEGPGMFAENAIAYGVQKGRRGLGSIYVVSAGNGGKSGDQCSYDGYVNSIYTIAVGSVSQDYQLPNYSERCAAILTVAPGVQRVGDDLRRAARLIDENMGMVTADIHDRCTTGHFGTSAAASIVSAIVALALEANPELSWRAVQYLIIQSSRALSFRCMPALFDECETSAWVANGRGRLVSDAFGYGMIDAERMIRGAELWRNQTLPEKSIKKIFMVRADLLPLVDVDGFERRAGMLIADGKCLKHCVKPCRRGRKKKKKRGCIRQLEHVQIILTMNRKERFRGSLQMYLISPQGTNVTLLRRRELDQIEVHGFESWPLTSVFYWGEDPTGCWTVEFRLSLPVKHMVLEELQLHLHGIGYQKGVWNSL